MSRLGGLPGWIRLIASCCAALAAVTGVAAALSWHASWVLTGLVGPLEALDLVAIGLAMLTLFVAQLALKAKSLPLRTLFFRAPAPLVAAALVISVAVGVSSTALENHKASSFYQESDSGASCWRIAKDHGAITRCVSHGKWLVVGRLDQLGNIAGLAIFLSLVVGFLAFLVFKTNNDDTPVTPQA